MVTSNSVKIFNLMGREDANASKAIATAAKKDSSAMKTIAVMTMAFLPATFFAALFAIPLLQWQGDNVMTERFLVYFAFTLPCTALVFFVWWVFGVEKENGVIGDAWKNLKERINLIIEKRQ